MSKVLVSESNLTAIANAVREKNGSAATYTPAQMAAAITALTGRPFDLGSIPAYVKSEAYAVAQKVRAAQTATTVTSIVYADAHHTKDQSSTNWQTQTNISTLHAAMGMAAIASMVPVDIALYAGDYTFGNGDTTLALFEGQVEEMNRYMDFAFSGIPALYCVGNHDTGEYYLRDGGGSLYGASTIYNLIGSRNDDGTTVMGSTTYGYCYRDLTAKKTRIICLNTVEGETTGGYSGGQCSDAQLLWFAQALYGVGANSDWNIIVVSHYPLDYGGTYKAGNIVYEYVNGGSITYNGTTVNFSGHNLAKFAAQYHGHTHCLKAAKLNRIVNNAGTEFDAWRIATPSGTYYRNNDYAGVLVYGIDFGESTTYPKTADTGDDTAFVVNVYNPERGIISSFCYGAGYDRVVSIGATVYHAITNALTHVNNSNTDTAIEDGSSYTGTLTADSGYDMASVTVTMGNTDITSSAYNSSTGVVSIASVTGNVTITASASVHVSYTNLVPTATDENGNIAPYENGMALGSSGASQAGSGYICTGFIAIPDGKTQHTYRIAGNGISFAAADSYNRIAWYDSTHTKVGVVVAANKLDSSQYFPETVSEETTACTIVCSKAFYGSNVPTDAAYFRISAKGSDGANLIITLDEEIDTY